MTKRVYELDAALRIGGIVLKLQVQARIYGIGIAGNCSDYVQTFPVKSMLYKRRFASWSPCPTNIRQ